MSIEAMCKEFPEVRIHLAHLRAAHQQRLMGGHVPVLPRLNTKEVDPDERISIRIQLAPEVVDAFKATGTGWKARINDVLLELVGKEGKPGKKRECPV